MPGQYQIPSWLETSPNDVANKFATGVQIGAQLGEARNRLAQQAQQSAVETQVTQDKLAASMLQQQQELNVKKAYEDQQVALAQQKIQAAQAKVGLETVKAARQFQAQQAYQKDYQAGLDMGLPEDEAARGSYFKNLVQFGSPASQASAMRPGKSSLAQVPQFMTSPSGAEIAYNPASGHFARTDTFRGNAQAPGFWTKFNANSLEREMASLRTARSKASEAMAYDPAQKQIYDEAGNRINAINQKLQQMQQGGGAAPSPSAAGGKFRFNPTTGKIEPVSDQASAPADDNEDYTGEE